MFPASVPRVLKIAGWITSLWRNVLESLFSKVTEELKTLLTLVLLCSEKKFFKKFWELPFQPELQAYSLQFATILKTSSNPDLINVLWNLQKNTGSDLYYSSIIVNYMPANYSPQPSVFLKLLKYVSRGVLFYNNRVYTEQLLYSAAKSPRLVFSKTTSS